MPMKTTEKNTYKNAGFFLRQRELARRRLWPIALTFLSHLIYNVVCTVTVLSSTLEEAVLNHSSASETTRSLQNALSSFLGKDNLSWVLLALPLAAMLAIEGFSWLHNRREVDFYESLPVPRGQRFFDICAGSFLYYVVSYIFTLEIGLLIANGFGALSHPILVEIMQTAVKTIAFFLAIYALGVLSTMLTGNAIVTCLAFGVLLFYEMEFRALIQGYCSEYFATWSSRPSPALKKSLFSPIEHYLDHTVSEAVPRLLALAVLFFLLSWICCRLRRNERAGSAVVFTPVQTVVRVAMSLLIGLFTGLLVSSIRTSRGIIISVIWMLLFTVITACIMQIIYEYDFRALFHRPLEIIAALVLSLLFFAVFVFDLTGYDRFVPDPGKVSDAALICSNNPFDYSTEDGSQINAEDFGEQYMRLDNVEDVIAIASYGQEFTLKKDRIYDTYRENASGEAEVPDTYEENEENESGAAAVPVDPDNSTDPVTSGEHSDQHVWRSYEEFDCLVVYHMKSGKTISRKFRLPSTIDPAMMDHVVGTDQYREGAFNIYHDNAVRNMPENFLFECTNGKDEASINLTAAQYEAFRKAYIADLTAYSYTFARENVPAARVMFSYNPLHGQDKQPDYAGLTVSYPVYPSFENTIRVLNDCKIWKEPLDYTVLLRGNNDYNSLTPEEQKLYDYIDMSVFSAPFNIEGSYETADYYD